MNEIVVGLDLSPSATAALHWAAAQGRRTGRPVRAVHGLLVPVSIAPMGVVTYSPTHVPDDRVELTYRNAVSTVWNSVQPEPEWKLEFYNDDPGPLLAWQSNGASLLVIGTREHVGFGRMLLGSVSHYCLSHARCPVVAVPAERRNRHSPAFAREEARSTVSPTS